MGQLDALKAGKQGSSLIKSDPNYTGTTYDFGGKGLPERPGANKLNDLHYDGTGHVHRDPTLPFAGGQNGLAARALTLQGSSYSNTTKYSDNPPA